ncbi:MAG: PQQ-dependent sugar dehydrogenase [Microthrixaceae bacterium]
MVGNDGIRKAAHARALIVLGTLTLVAAACVPPVPSEPPGVPTVGVHAEVGGFNRPWALGFTPDGAILVTERGGTLAAVVGGTRVVVGAVPGVVANGEGGLMGLAVDPDFATNRRIFLCHANGSGSSVTDVRIVAALVAPGYTSVGSFTPILTGIASGSGNRHLGCRLAFGPDAMLWATTGDAARGIHPQDPTSLAGKVLRMTTAGAPAPGNPGGSLNGHVYTLGHRNPQGIAFRPSDGAAFSAEHGPSCDDEVNLLTAGANYGWAPTGGAGGYGEGVPMTFSGATQAVWSSGCPTIAPSGAAFISGTHWGALDNQLVMAVLKDRQLRFVRMNGNAVLGTEVAVTDKGRLRAAHMGPDGFLWVAQDSSSGSVLKVGPI